jgi:hypothetical protein
MKISSISIVDFYVFIWTKNNLDPQNAMKDNIIWK